MVSIGIYVFTTVAFEGWFGLNGKTEFSLQIDSKFVGIEVIAVVCAGYIA